MFCERAARWLNANSEEPRICIMPDVGLFSAAEPLPKSAKVIIKYSVEVEGLPVYTETCDVAKLAKELKKDEPKALELWSRRIKCVAACRSLHGFSACLTQCLADGTACDHGDSKTGNR